MGLGFIDLAGMIYDKFMRSNLKLSVLVILWACFAGSVVAQTNDLAKSKQQVDNLRLWHSPDKTRVVFDVSADVVHTLFTLNNPLRLVVDIENADLNIALPELAADNGHIHTIRFGRPKQNTLRFVLELTKPLKTDSFILTPNELYGYRLVVDLLDESALTAGTTTTAAAKQGAIAPAAPGAAGANNGEALPNTVQSPVQSPTNRSLEPVIQSVDEARNKPLVVAIDAGHGGEDPGAIGYRGSQEKKITLSIAKRLKKVIDADPRMRAVLIRTGDYYIKLHQRRKMARDEHRADVFVSVHADAFRKRSARGLSVFALSQRGATSAMARALAAKENASDLIGGVSLADKDAVLAQVLVDLSMTNTISESVNLGGRVLKELSKVGKLHSRRVEQAGFAVLKSPDMPSILVETGFITNPDEERNLRSPQYQQRIAKAIYTAISEYYEQTPYFNNGNYASPVIASSAPGSAKTGKPVHSSPSKPRYHKVVRGDSLSKIALRYGTSVKELKRLNGLRHNTAVLGQRLKVPGGKENSNTARKTTTKRAEIPAVHIVRRGDSLSKISARYNVTIRALKSLNKLQRNTVYLGQKIKLPQARLSRASKPKTHKVKRGDTLSEIAEAYGSTVKEIMALNKLRSRTVLLGQTLKIPN